MPCRIVPTEPPRAGDSSRPLPSPADLLSSRLCLLPPEKAYFTPTCSCPLPPTFRQHTPAPRLAFSCGRRGTAPRWMRSNALPYSKTSTEGKNASSVSLRLPPSPTGEGIFYPHLFLPSPANLPSTIPTSAPRLAFSCGRRGTAPRWMRSNALKPRPRSKYVTVQ